jgi:hypothetical protein
MLLTWHQIHFRASSQTIAAATEMERLTDMEQSMETETAMAMGMS